MPNKSNFNQETRQRKNTAEMIADKIKKKNPNWKGYHKRTVTRAQESNLNRLEHENFKVNMQDDLKRRNKVLKHDPYVSQHHLGLIDEIPNEMPNIGTQELYDRYERARKQFEQGNRMDRKVYQKLTMEVRAGIEEVKAYTEVMKENRKLREEKRNLEEQVRKLQERLTVADIKQDDSVELTSQEDVVKDDKGKVSSMDQESTAYDPLNQRAKREPSFLERIRGLERESFSNASLKGGLKNVSTSIPADKESGKELGYFLLAWAAWTGGMTVFWYVGLDWHLLSSVLTKSFFLIPFKKVSKG